MSVAWCIAIVANMVQVIKGLIQLGALIRKTWQRIKAKAADPVTSRMRPSQWSRLRSASETFSVISSVAAIAALFALLITTPASDPRAFMVLLAVLVVLAIRPR